MHKEDNPLVAAQSALRLAEQQVREGKSEGANANLQIAKVQLETYRTLVGDAEAQPAMQLDNEITALQFAHHGVRGIGPNGGDAHARRQLDPIELRLAQVGQCPRRRTGFGDAGAHALDLEDAVGRART